MKEYFSCISTSISNKLKYLMSNLGSTARCLPFRSSDTWKCTCMLSLESHSKVIFTCIICTIFKSAFSALSLKGLNRQSWMINLWTYIYALFLKMFDFHSIFCWEVIHELALNGLFVNAFSTYLVLKFDYRSHKLIMFSHKNNKFVKWQIFIIWFVV